MPVKKINASTCKPCGFEGNICTGKISPNFSFNRSIPLVIQKLSVVPISSNQSPQENSEIEDDETRKLMPFQKMTIIDVIDLVE